jgi:hypothetical protein
VNPLMSAAWARRPGGFEYRLGASL